MSAGSDLHVLAWVGVLFCERPLDTFSALGVLSSRAALIIF